MTRGTLLAATGAALALVTGSAIAQDMPRWKFDPYTQNKPHMIEKAGYIALGTEIPFGQRGAQTVTTADIDKHLDYARIRWVETPHFRLGSSLETVSVPQDREIKAKIRAELERLQKKLPTVNPRTRRLDPWLRTHLFAQRAEEHYAEIQKWFGVQDSDFPASMKDVIRMPDKTFMGFGPFLGMQDKYLLLLTEHEGTYVDYIKSFAGRDTRFGQRWHYKDVGSLFYGVSTESDDRRLKDDTALHCNVVFNLTINLFDGFRHYSYDSPVWIREGLGHWFERRVNERFNSFDQDEGSTLDIRSTWKWESHTRKIIGTDKYAPFSEAYGWRNYGQIKFDDHVALWSRVDYLLSFGPEKFKTFLFHIKGRVDADWTPDPSDLVGAHREALREAYGLNPLTLDEKWQQWVYENYSTR